MTSSADPSVSGRPSGRPDERAAGAPPDVATGSRRSTDAAFDDLLARLERARLDVRARFDAVTPTVDTATEPAAAPSLGATQGPLESDIAPAGQDVQDAPNAPIVSDVPSTPERWRPQHASPAQRPVTVPPDEVRSPGGTRRGAVARVRARRGALRSVIGDVAGDVRAASRVALARLRHAARTVAHRAAAAGRSTRRSGHVVLARSRGALLGTRRTVARVAATARVRGARISITTTSAARRAMSSLISTAVSNANAAVTSVRETLADAARTTSAKVVLGRQRVIEAARHVRSAALDPVARGWTAVHRAAVVGRARVAAAAVAARGAGVIALRGMVDAALRVLVATRAAVDEAGHRLLGAVEDGIKALVDAVRRAVRRVRSVLVAVARLGVGRVHVASVVAWRATTRSVVAAGVSVQSAGMAVGAAAVASALAVVWCWSAIVHRVRGAVRATVAVLVLAGTEVRCRVSSGAVAAFEAVVGALVAAWRGLGRASVAVGVAVRDAVVAARDRIASSVRAAVRWWSAVVRRTWSSLLCAVRRGVSRVRSMSMAVGRGAVRAVVGAAVAVRGGVRAAVAGLVLVGIGVRCRVSSGVVAAFEAVVGALVAVARGLHRAAVAAIEAARRAVLALRRAFVRVVLGLRDAFVRVVLGLRDAFVRARTVAARSARAVAVAIVAGVRAAAAAVHAAARRSVAVAHHAVRTARAAASRAVDAVAGTVVRTVHAAVGGVVRAGRSARATVAFATATVVASLRSTVRGASDRTLALVAALVGTVRRTGARTRDGLYSRVLAVGDVVRRLRRSLLTSTRAGATALVRTASESVGRVVARWPLDRPASATPPRGPRARRLPTRVRSTARAVALLAGAVIALDVVLGVDAPVLVVSEPPAVRTSPAADAIATAPRPSGPSPLPSTSRTGVDDADAPVGVVDAVPAGPEVSVASAPPSGPTPEPVPDRAPVTTDAMLTVPTAGPARVVIPVLSVTSDVVGVGLEPDGALEIPEDVRTVGWYVPPSGRTVLPGAAGTAVLAGHVDSRVQGPGVFNRIRTLRPGNAVVVVHDDGTETVWQVDEVIRYPKADVPIADIFLFEGEPRLALITCGGDFDRASGSYLDNYVVLASRSG